MAHNDKVADAELLKAIRAKEKENWLRVGLLRIDSNQMAQHHDGVADTLGILRFVPLKAEANIGLNCIEMVGISFMFDKLPPGATAPYYAVYVETDEGGRQMLRVEKQDKGTSDETTGQN